MGASPRTTLDWCEFHTFFVVEVEHVTPISHRSIVRSIHRMSLRPRASYWDVPMCSWRNAMIFCRAALGSDLCFKRPGRFWNGQHTHGHKPRFDQPIYPMMVVPACPFAWRRRMARGNRALQRL